VSESVVSKGEGRKRGENVCGVGVYIATSVYSIGSFASQIRNGLLTIKNSRRWFLVSTSCADDGAAFLRCSVSFQGAHQRLVCVGDCLYYLILNPLFWLDTEVSSRCDPELH
jgi:hypothetical protein